MSEVPGKIYYDVEFYISVSNRGGGGLKHTYRWNERKFTAQGKEPSERMAWFTVEGRRDGRKENYIMACHNVHLEYQQWN
jgi:hypothetical protein